MAREAKAKSKVTFEIDTDDLARFQAAIVNTQGTEGIRSMTAVLAHLAVAEAARLENEHNGGNPWPPIPTGTLPRGRRIGG